MTSYPKVDHSAHPPLLSVIIPVYNCENFLDRCIQNLQAQTYQNWVAIIVNDGSKDRSQEIIEQYASQDARIQIINKDNGGAASARNAGLDIARTEYITMIDADDTISPDALELMMKAVTETECDIVIAACATKQNNGSITYDNQKYSGFMEATPLFFFRNVYRTPYAKLYRRDIIEQYHLRMPEDMVMAEDYVFVTSYWTRCRTVYFIPKPLYNYCYAENENSLIHRFCRKELPYEVYQMNAVAAWRSFRFLISAEKDKASISAWTYELYRDLWKMSNNSCRYLTNEEDKKKLRQSIKEKDKEMSAYLPFFKRLFMPHRYPSLSTLLMKIKKLLKR